MNVKHAYRTILFAGRFTAGLRAMVVQNAASQTVKPMN
jgi:hypothetical protein